MKTSILILAVALATLTSCSESHKLHVDRRTFTVADPEELLSEDANNPGVFISSHDSIIVTQKKMYFGYTGKPFSVKNKIRYKK